VAIGIAEVEEDLGGDEGGTAVSDAAGHGEALVILHAGLGFEEIEDGVEGVGGGDGVELGIDPVEEPISKRGGADGEDAAGRDGDLNEDLAVAGGEGGALPDDLHEARDG